MPQSTERVPAVSEREGSFSRGSRNPRAKPEDAKPAGRQEGTGAAAVLFSQIVNWELGSHDGPDPRQFSQVSAVQQNAAEPTIFDLLDLVAPPLK